MELATGTATWYHGGLPPVAIRWVLVRDPPGAFEPQALLATDPTAAAAAAVQWVAPRWQVEVPCHEVRAHPGVETQRQWSDTAILRTTPARLGLSSIVTWCAHASLQGQPLPVRRAAWYHKPTPTFIDALALVRRHLWPLPMLSCPAPAPADRLIIPRALWQRCTETLAFAA